MVWFDRDVLRLNYDGRGEELGEFQSDDLILVILQNGYFYTTNFDLSNHYEPNILSIEKFDANKVWTAALYDADQKYYYLKRFQLEAGSRKQNFLGENPKSHLMLLTDEAYPRIEVVFGGHDAFRAQLVHDAVEGRTHGVADDQVRVRVGRGRGGVHENQVVPGEVVDEASSRVHHEGRSGHDQRGRSRDG